MRGWEAKTCEIMTLQLNEDFRRLRWMRAFFVEANGRATI